MPDSSRYAPPELAQGGWDVIKKNPHSAVDSFNYGVLVFEAFNGDYNGGQAGQTSNVPPTMHSSYKRLCNANPKARISVANFLDQGNRTGSFFDNPLIKLTEGIDNLGVKSADEREEFLKYAPATVRCNSADASSDLDQVTDDFPEEFFKMKVLPELIKSVEFGGGGPKALGVILKIAAKLPSDDFEAKILPFIVKMFANPDRAVRVYLLDNLPLIFDRLPPKVVNDKVFPCIVSGALHTNSRSKANSWAQMSGFTDIQPVVREQTLKSVLVLITKLTDRTINGDLLKQLAKTANDEQPGIRTNTTICLGKIAKYLGTSSRSKVLIAAFTRSLRDPFVHARNAALMSLAATTEYLTEEDCAARVMPALCPLLIDKEKMIRDQANRTLETYLQKVRKAAASMPDSALPPQQAGEGQAARMGTPQPSGSGWTGWAVSSFTNKLSAAAGDMKTTNGSRAVSPRPPTTDGRKPSGGTATPSLHRQAVGSPIMSGTSSPGASANAVADAFWANDFGEDAAADDDAWGEMGDDDEVIPSSSAAAAKAAEHVKAVPFEQDEPDFAGWLAAQADKKKPGIGKPLPKGLAKSTPATAAKKPVAKAVRPVAAKTLAAKKIDLKPKEAEEEEDEGWGDGW